MDTNDVAKVQQFLKLSRNATRNEIAGGTGLNRDVVDAILAAVVAAGGIIKTGEANTATYSLAGQSATVSAPEPEDRRSSEQIWSDNERARAMVDWKRTHPEEFPAPQKRYSPSDEEISAFAESQKVAPLTPEQRRELERMTNGRTPVNPQIAIKR